MQIREEKLTGGVLNSSPISDKEQRCQHWSRERRYQVSHAGSSNCRRCCMAAAAAVKRMEISRLALTDI
jgi:hypothetical protein